MRTKGGFLINDRVRSSLEVLEPDTTGPGFQLAAIVYGDNAETTRLRAELVSEWLTLEGSGMHLRKRMRRVAIYTWAGRMYKQRRWPLAFYELLMWVLGVYVDTDTIADWLHTQWPRQGGVNG